MPRKYIKFVVGTTDNEKTWFVKFSDNPEKIVAIKKVKAKRYLLKKTEYVLERVSCVFRENNGPPMVIIKYLGFKKPREVLASTVI